MVFFRWHSWIFRGSGYCWGSYSFQKGSDGFYSFQLAFCVWAPPWGHFKVLSWGVWEDIGRNLYLHYFLFLMDKDQPVRYFFCWVIWPKNKIDSDRCRMWKIIVLMVHEYSYLQVALLLSCFKSTLFWLCTHAHSETQIQNLLGNLRLWSFWKENESYLVIGWNALQNKHHSIYAGRCWSVSKGWGREPIISRCGWGVAPLWGW